MDEEYARQTFDNAVVSALTEQYHFERTEDFIRLLNEDLKFDEHCFICRSKMGSISREHIIPRWILSEFDSYPELVNVPNKSKLQFRHLTIPCCSECNSGILSQLEKTIQKLFEKGKRGMNEWDDWAIFAWSLKVYIGLCIKSNHLKSDIRDPKSGPIFSNEYIESLKPLFTLLLTIKYPIVFENFKPYSIFKFDFEDSSSYESISFLTHQAFHCLMFRYKNFGYIISFNDDNLLWHIYQNEYIKLKKIKISLEKLIEVYSKCLTTLHLIHGRDKFYTILQKPNGVPHIASMVEPKKKIEGMKLYDKALAQKYLKENYAKLGLSEEEIE